MKLYHLNTNDPWVLGEDIPDIDLSFSQIWLSSFPNEFARPGGRAYQKVLTIFRGCHLWFYYGDRDSYAVGEHLVRRFLREPKFALEVNRKIIETADELRHFVHQLPEDHLDTFLNAQLARLYATYDRLHTEYYQWGWIPVGADMFHANFTEKLKAYLRTIDVSEENINEELVILTSPTQKSLIQKEREAFLKLGIRIQKDNKTRKLFFDLFRRFKEQEAAKLGYETHTKEYEAALEARMLEIKDRLKPWVLDAIQKHYLSYYYVKFMWIGKDGFTTFDQYLKELVRLVATHADVTKILRTEQQEFVLSLRARAALMRKRKITGKWRILFDAFGDFMVTKIYRRYAQIYAVVRMQPILEEIGKRLGLSLKEMRFVLTSEAVTMLAGTKRVNKKELARRTRFCTYYVERGQEVVYTGTRAKRLLKMIELKELGDVAELHGQTGCVGHASGTVKIIVRASDMNKMKPGDVLVSIATDPDILPAMKKAAAIVTEQGGVTSHAAIVSREMRIPCVIGTKIATRVLKDGDRVDVDATRGIVKKMTA